MPAGHDLTELEVPPGHVARLYCDDISDMYPSFTAYAGRACTNSLAMELDLNECLDFKA